MDPEKRKDVVAGVRHVFETEARAIANLGEIVDNPIVEAVDKVLACDGRVVVTGIGKAGIIGQKISATLASTGTPSLFLHAAEALHGDLGRIKKEDVVLALSNSGTTREIVNLLNAVKKIGACLISITSDAKSPLAKYSDVPICYGEVAEACPLGLTPTTSTTIMLAIGDAVAMATLRRRHFSKEEFALFHPAGALGQKLLKVTDEMRAGEQNPLIREDKKVMEALSVMTHTPGKPGAVSIVDKDGKLVGFYTDGDLRRRLEAAMESGDFSVFEKPIAGIMTQQPKSIFYDKLAGEALRILRENKIDQIPVIDENGKPVGIVDVQDLLTVRIV